MNGDGETSPKEAGSLKSANGIDAVFPICIPQETDTAVCTLCCGSYLDRVGNMGNHLRIERP